MYGTKTWRVRGARCAVLLTLALATGAHADWTYRDTSAVPDDFAPAAAGAGRNGFWLVGSNAGGSTDVVAHYGNDGTLHGLRYLDRWELRNYRAPEPPLALADGDMLVLNPNASDDEPIDGTLARLSPDGELRWSAEVPERLHLVGADAHGGSWLTSPYGLFRAAPDGTVRIVASATAGVGTVDAASGTLYLAAPATAPSANAAAQPSIVTAYATDGTANVLYTPADATVAVSYLARDAAGNLYAVGTRGAAGARLVYAFSLDAHGALRWEKSLNAGVDTIDDTSVTAATLLPDATLLALDAREILFRFDASGNGQVLNGLGNGLRCDPVQGCRDAMQAVAGGAAVLLTTVATQLVRVDSLGHVGATTTLSDIDPTQATLTLLDNGNALVAAYGTLPQLAIVTPDGARIAAPQLHGALSSGAGLQAMAQAADGSAFLLSAAARKAAFAQGGYGYQPQYWLTKLDGSGNVAWRQDLPYQYVQGYVLGADRLCTAAFQYAVAPPSQTIECRATADGRLLWSAPVGGDGLVTLRLLDDARVVAVVTPASGDTHLLLFDANGYTLNDTALAMQIFPGQTPLAIARNGTVVASALSAYGRVYAWDVQGRQLYAARAPLQTSGYLDTQPVLADDGTALLAPYAFANDNGTQFAWLIEADGSTRWFAPQTNATSGLVPLALDAGTATLVRLASDAPPHLRRLLARDGSLRSDVSTGGNSFVAPNVDAVTGLLLDGSLPQTGGRRRVRVLDPATAAVLRSVAEDCGAGTCDTESSGFAALSSDRTLHVARGTFDAQAGLHFTVHAYAHGDTPPPGIALDQAGIDGVWYGAYEAGQGFTIDVFGAQKTLFMPWFTFANDLQNAPSAPAWYALSGSIEPGATSAQLDIGSPLPGVFAAGTTSVARSGSAVLTLSDCNSGLLVYQFDATSNFGFGGAIALSRLSPSTSPCVLADGSSVPPALTSAARDGFDARQSGSWHDAAHDGQGIEFTVIPAGDGFAGLVFGAWFTFQAPGALDDPFHSHWFTLQSDLSAAKDGSVELPILSTLGGTFDGLPTANTQTVGSATLTFTACDAATLAYRFLDSEIAHTYRGLSGTVSLSRIGGCAGP